MSLLLDVLIAVIVLLVLVVLAVIAIYNGLISKRNRVQDAWAQIDVQLKRRYDLIPNLIETVKGYMKYEKSTLTQITALRSSIMTGSAPDRANANNMLSQTLKSLFAVVENYPDLKANQSYLNLQQQLTDTEDKIAFVRTSYNDYVLDFNNSIQQFPGNIFAPRFGFKKADFFQAPEEEKAAVKVSFDDASTIGGTSQPQAQQPQQPSPPSPKGQKKQDGSK
jgi:LemA protein